METHAKNETTLPVLVVDDDSGIRETVRLTLEDEGYVVLEAPDGRTALGELRSSARPLIVLLDHLMPELDGLETLDTIAADPLLAQRHAYIMLTADGRSEPVRLTSGGDEWKIPIVAKPFDLEDLLAAVAQARDSLLAAPRQYTDKR